MVSHLLWRPSSLSSNSRLFPRPAAAPSTPALASRRSDLQFQARLLPLSPLGVPVPQTLLSPQLLVPHSHPGLQVPLVLDRVPLPPRVYRQVQLLPVLHSLLVGRRVLVPHKALAAPSLPVRQDLPVLRSLHRQAQLVLDPQSLLAPRLLEPRSLPVPQRAQVLRRLLVPQNRHQQARAPRLSQHQLCTPATTLIFLWRRSCVAFATSCRSSQQRLYPPGSFSMT